MAADEGVMRAAVRELVAVVAVGLLHGWGLGLLFEREVRSPTREIATAMLLLAITMTSWCWARAAERAALVEASLRVIEQLVDNDEAPLRATVHAIRVQVIGARR